MAGDAPRVEDACALLESALAGSFRRDIVTEVSKAPTMGVALARLREAMRAHAWTVRGRIVDLARFVAPYDARTRADGFHALNDWDGIADSVNADIIPVDVLSYVIARRGGDAVEPSVVATLLDYYFFHLLTLVSLRIWDGGDANAHLDRIDALLRLLQGADGSGQPFAARAETLLLVATSHFELVERGYAALLARVRTLDRRRQLAVALAHASSIGSHLRFGFEATYGRDTAATRQDNAADYPWLCHALATVMEEYVRLHDAGAEGPERSTAVEALINGLSPDARAFVGDAPASLAASEAERSAFRTRFLDHRAGLLEEFEAHRPSAKTYSPLSFFFNFSHNVLKGTIVDALLRDSVWTLTFDDLLTAVPADSDRNALKAALAGTLMAYARANPHRIRGRLMPVIVYDPDAGRRAFGVAMRKLRE